MAKPRNLEVLDCDIIWLSNIITGLHGCLCCVENVIKFVLFILISKLFSLKCFIKKDRFNSDRISISLWDLADIFKIASSALLYYGYHPPNVCEKSLKMRHLHNEFYKTLAIRLVFRDVYIRTDSYVEFIFIFWIQGIST